MPLDVLSKIQSFANGGTVDANTRGQVNDMLGATQQNAQLHNAISSVADSFTNGGESIDAESLNKVLGVSQSIIKAFDRATMSAYGFKGSVESISAKSLEKVERAIDGISNRSGDIGMSIGTKDAERSLVGVLRHIEKIKTNASMNFNLTQSSSRVSNPASSPHSNQKFANGGRVTYHRQNTDTAQTGGIFHHGSVAGDRNVIFANKGEGIITARAISQGARQRGMSPERYVQALNHPETNLGKIKRGKSFQYGGLLNSNVDSTALAPDAQKKWQNLKRYLNSDDFHGRGKLSGEKLQKSLDNFARSLGVGQDPSTHKLTGLTGEAIKKIVRKAQSLESDYKDVVESAVSGLRSGGLGKQKFNASTASTSPAMSEGIKNFNRDISDPTVSTSSIVPSHTTAESRDNLKKAASATLSNSSTEFEMMSDNKQNSFSGKMRKSVNESLSEINKFLQDKTADQIDALDSFLKQVGVSNGIDDVKAAIDNFESDLLSNAEETAKKFKGLSIAIKNLNFDALTEKYEKELSKLREKAFEELTAGNLHKTAISGLQGIDIESNLKKMMSTSTDKDTKQKAKDIFVGFDEIKGNKNTSKMAQYMLEQEFGSTANLSDLIQKLSEGKGSTGTIDTYAETLKKLSDIMKKIGDKDLPTLEDQSKDMEKAWSDEADKMKKLLRQTWILNKLSDDQIAKAAIGVAAVSLLAKSFDALAKKTADFVLKQAELSKGMTVVSQSIDTFAGKAVAFDSMRRSLNLTREQAVAFGNAMKDVALSGVHSVDTVNLIASNLKDSLGKVDLSLLKEAVDLINDLPKEQVDVMINGVGSFDDKANLIANLMDSGKIEKTIDLMMNGAFGKMDGSVQLSEKDKAVIQAQEEANLLLDKINEGIYSLIPKGFASMSVKYAKMIGMAAKAASSLWFLLTINKNVAFIAAQKGMKAMKGGMGAVGSDLVAGAVVAAIGIAISAAISAGFKMWASHQRKQNRDRYEREREQNIQRYGNSVGWRGLEDKDNAKRAETTAKATMALGSLTSVAMGAAVAFSTLTLGVGALITGVAVAGVALASFAASNNLDGGNAFTTFEKRSWYNPAGWFGNDFDVEEGKTEDEKREIELRKKYYESVLKELDDIAKKTGRADSKKLLAELVSARKHLKAMELIVDKSAYTKAEESNFSASMDILKQLRTVGGFGTRYQGIKNQAYDSNRRSYVRQTRMLRAETQRIVTDDSMGTEMQMNMINQVISKETKMHEKFVANMDNLIKTLGETPNVIVSDLKQRLNEAFNDFASKGFLDNRLTAKDSAIKDIGAIPDSIHDITSDYYNSLREINSSIRQMDEELQKGDEALKALGDNVQTTFDSMKNSWTADELAKLPESIREAVTGKDSEGRDVKKPMNDELANDIINHVTTLANDNPELGKKMEYSTLAADLNELVNKADVALSKGNKEEYSSLAGEIRTQKSTLIEKLRQGWTEAHNNGDTDLATELKTQIKNLEKIEEGMDDKTVIQTAKKLYASSTELKLLGSLFEDALAQKNPQLAKLYELAREQLTVSRGLASARDTRVLKQQQKTALGEQLVQKIEAQTKKFLNSLDSILNNGAVQFAKALREVLEKSEQYNLFGGTDAAFKTIEASIGELSETRKAINDAHDVVGGNYDHEMQKLQDTMNDYFNGKDAELQKTAENWKGNLPQQEIAANTERMLKEMEELNETMLRKQQEEDVAKAAPGIYDELGKDVRGENSNFAQVSEKNLKAMGFSNKEQAQQATNAEVGEVLFNFEQKLIKQLMESKNLTEENATIEARKQINDMLGTKNSDVSLDEANASMNEAKSKSSNDLAQYRQRRNERKEQLEQQLQKELEQKETENLAEQSSNQIGREYAKLIVATTKAQRRYMVEGTEESRIAYESAKAEQQNFEANHLDALTEETKNDIKAMSLGMATMNQVEMKMMQSEAQWRSEFMRVFNLIPGILEKIMVSGDALVSSARQGALEAKQTAVGKYTSVSEAYDMTDSVMANAGKLLKEQLANIGNDETVARLEKQKQDLMASAKADPNNRPEQLARMEQALDEKVIEAKYNAEVKAKDKYIDSIKKAMNVAEEALNRSSQGLEIQKDLYETIGAPFEYILDIEQQMVRNAKENYEIQQRLLDEMEANNISGVAYEEQKLKAAKAQAEVIKAQYGAQRNAIEKLLGQMFGTFEKIGGIFGPDSEFMKARKVGQGYTDLPSGMIAASGGSTSEQMTRAMGLAEAAGGIPRGIKTARGQSTAFNGMAEGGSSVEDAVKPRKIGYGQYVGGPSQGDRNYVEFGSGRKAFINSYEWVVNKEDWKRFATAHGLSEQQLFNAFKETPRFDGGGTSRGFNSLYSKRGMPTQDRNGRISSTMSVETGVNGTRADFERIYRDLEERKVSDEERINAYKALGISRIGGFAYDDRVFDSDGNWVVPSEGNNVGTDKKVISASPAKQDFAGNLRQKISRDLNNSAFGGSAGEQGGQEAGGLSVSTNANLILLKILKDTHKIVEAMGSTVDWEELGNLEKSLTGKVKEDTAKRQSEASTNSMLASAPAENTSARREFMSGIGLVEHATKSTEELEQLKKDLRESPTATGTARKISQINAALVHDRLNHKQTPETRTENKVVSSTNDILDYVKKIYLALVGGGEPVQRYVEVPAYEKGTGNQEGKRGGETGAGSVPQGGTATPSPLGARKGWRPDGGSAPQVGLPPTAGQNENGLDEEKRRMLKEQTIREMLRQTNRRHVYDLQNRKFNYNHKYDPNQIQSIIGMENRLVRMNGLSGVLATAQSPLNVFAGASGLGFGAYNSYQHGKQALEALQNGDYGQSTVSGLGSVWNTGLAYVGASNLMQAAGWSGLKGAGAVSRWLPWLGTAYNAGRMFLNWRDMNSAQYNAFLEETSSGDMARTLNAFNGGFNPGMVLLNTALHGIGETGRIVQAGKYGLNASQTINTVMSQVLQEAAVARAGIEKPQLSVYQSLMGNGGHLQNALHNQLSINESQRRNQGWTILDLFGLYDDYTETANKDAVDAHGLSAWELAKRYAAPLFDLDRDQRFKHLQEYHAQNNKDIQRYIDQLVKEQGEGFKKTNDYYALVEQMGLGEIIGQAKSYEEAAAGVKERVQKLDEQKDEYDQGSDNYRSVYTRKQYAEKWQRAIGFEMGIDDLKKQMEEQMQKDIQRYARDTEGNQSGYGGSAMENFQDILKAADDFYAAHGDNEEVESEFARKLGVDAGKLSQLKADRDLHQVMEFSNGQAATGFADFEKALEASGFTDQQKEMARKNKDVFERFIDANGKNEKIDAEFANIFGYLNENGVVDEENLQKLREQRDAFHATDFARKRLETEDFLMIDNDMEDAGFTEEQKAQVRQKMVAYEKLMSAHGRDEELEREFAEGFGIMDENGEISKEQMDSFIHYRDDKQTYDLASKLISASKKDRPSILATAQSSGMTQEQIDKATGLVKEQDKQKRQDPVVQGIKRLIVAQENNSEESLLGYARKIYRLLRKKFLHGYGTSYGSDESEYAYGPGPKDPGSGGSQGGGNPNGGGGNPNGGENAPNEEGGQPPSPEGNAPGGSGDSPNGGAPGEGDNLPPPAEPEDGTGTDASEGEEGTGRGATEPDTPPAPSDDSSASDTTPGKYDDPNSDVANEVNEAMNARHAHENGLATGDVAAAFATGGGIPGANGANGGNGGGANGGVSNGVNTGKILGTIVLDVNVKLDTDYLKKGVVDIVKSNFDVILRG